MRILFLGSGEVACPALELLLADPAYTVVAVVSQPDKPQGRNRTLGACPAKRLAEACGVPTLTPARIGAPAAVAEIAALQPDVMVVAAYGQYIKPEILALPPLGAINIHPSLLPKYRGATPIQWAVANGDTETGVTILYVAGKMDAGDILAQRRYPIEPDDTAASLTPKLAVAGAALLMETLAELRAGTACARPQDEANATVVYKLEKDDGRIDWTLPAVTIRNRIRGFTPWPGCFTQVRGKRLKILRARVLSGPAMMTPPGAVIRCEADGPVIATGADGLLLTEVQPEGKKAMSAAAFLCGRTLAVGEQLG
jgi:methionyl-tRNA formyltransferase